ncbi:hypothetical protein HNY73_005012 [Argiope bruennichi]|uniref:DUF7041 domain-containing protein n=1 Tax=Argiope bruennichi TaxID=94029 RepID=A0A8T0FQV1_ARGBR|nr:hypothetical protein HNY73_005012 [Argiope bruennichi]
MLNTENETVNADAPTESQVTHLSVKIPPLWRNNIKLWFIQVERNFAIAKISNDLTKYNHLIATIDPETLSAVADILLAYPDTNKYDALKARLIAEFSASENEQIRRLLPELHLGADKPSQLLRKMRELGGGTCIKDDFLKTLWLQRLPSEMHSILSISYEPLDNLANMADKIAEVRVSSTDSCVFAVSRGAENTGMRKASTLDEFTALRSEIAALRDESPIGERDPFRSRKNGGDESRIGEEEMRSGQERMEEMKAGLEKEIRSGQERMEEMKVGLEEEMRSGQERMEEMKAGLEKEIRSGQERMEEMKVGLEKEIRSGQERKEQELKKDIASVKEEFSNIIQEKMNSIEDKVASFENEVVSVETKVFEMEESIDKVRENIGINILKMEESIDKVREDIEKEFDRNSERRFESLKKQISH